MGGGGGGEVGGAFAPTRRISQVRRLLLNHTEFFFIPRLYGRIKRAFVLNIFFM